MTILVRGRFGRIVLHLLAMLGDQCVRFHLAGIARELPWVAALSTLLVRLPTQLRGALVDYFAKPTMPSKRRSMVLAKSAIQRAALVVIALVLPGGLVVAIVLWWHRRIHARG